MMWWNPEWHWTMMLGMAAFWILVIVAIVVAIRYLSTNIGRHAVDESPETILKRRYAGGQIDRDEYESRLSELRKSQ